MIKSHFERRSETLYIRSFKNRVSTFIKNIKYNFTNIFGDKNSEVVRSFAAGGRNNTQNLDKNSKASQLKEIENIKNIYDEGGLAAQIVDIYTNLITRKLWYIEVDGDITSDMSEELRKELDQIRIDSWLPHIIKESILYGYGVVRIVREGSGEGIRIKMCDSSKFRIIVDEEGETAGYYEILDMGKIKIYEEHEIIIINTIESYTPYGVSIIYKCIDDIKRDIKIVEGITTAIFRHGTPKIWHKLKGTEREPVTPEEARNYAEMVEGISFETDLITTDTTDQVMQFDTVTVPADIYNNFSIIRLCASAGIPGELLGLRVGTTDNTAIARISAFYDQIRGYQNTIASQITEQIISKLFGDKYNKYYFKFNLPTDDDVETDLKVVTELMRSNPIDPFWMGKDWVMEKMGIQNMGNFKPVKQGDFEGQLSEIRDSLRI